MIIYRTNQPTDSVICAEPLTDSTLSDFWRWAFSDLCDDDLKGIFAEWLVHRLLDIPSSRRVSWANSDIVTTNGVTLEVKATSYWQSWKVIDQHGQPHAEPLYKLPPDDSKIRFGGLTARDSANTDMFLDRSHKSQLYVFAFQHERDIKRWNAMDLTQWEFYVVRAEDLAQIGGQTIALSKLRHQYGPLTSAEFVSRAKELIEQVTRGPNAI